MDEATSTPWLTEVADDVAGWDDVRWYRRLWVLFATFVLFFPGLVVLVATGTFYLRWHGLVLRVTRAGLWMFVVADLIVLVLVLAGSSG